MAAAEIDENDTPNTTTTHEEPDGLMGLPPELRNYIYELAVTEQAAILLCGGHGNSQPGITRTCRQVRTESLPIYYAANTFDMKICFEEDYNSGYKECCRNSTSFKPRAAKWIREIGYSNLRHITTLRLDGHLTGRACIFDVTLRQDVRRRTLEAHRARFWTISVHHRGFDQAGLDGLLQRLASRKSEPGVSREGIRQIVDFFVHESGLLEDPSVPESKEQRDEGTGE